MYCHAAQIRRCCFALGCNGFKRLGQTVQIYPRASKALHPPYHVGQGTAQAVQLRDDDDVAHVEAGEQTMQFELLAAIVHIKLFLHDLLASCFGKGLA